jgi:hypothetical protein
MFEVVIAVSSLTAYTLEVSSLSTTSLIVLDLDHPNYIRRIIQIFYPEDAISKSLCNKTKSMKRELGLTSIKRVVQIKGQSTLQASVSKCKDMDTCNILQQAHRIAWNVQI